MEQPKNSELGKFVGDALRFIRHCKTAVENCPLQVYSSALLFSPAYSLVRRTFEQEQPQWLLTKSTISDDWSACVQRLEGNTDSSTCVAFSHDSSLIVSGGYGHAVKVWDTTAGHCLRTLHSHGGRVSSVVFSHDSKMIASASDTTVKLWDTATGDCLRTLDDYRHTVSFSYDSKLVASASHNNAVKIWDTATGHCLRTLNGHRGTVMSVVFSHNSKLVASASFDWTVKIWNATTNRCLQDRKSVV